MRTPIAIGRNIVKLIVAGFTKPVLVSSRIGWIRHSLTSSFTTSRRTEGEDKNHPDGAQDELQTADDPQEISLETFTLGRGRHERKDSITPEILNQRRKHYERITEWGEADDHDIRALENEGFGRKQRIHTGYNASKLFTSPAYSAADFSGSDSDEAQAVAEAMTTYAADSKSQIGAGK